MLGFAVWALLAAASPVAPWTKTVGPARVEVHNADLVDGRIRLGLSESLHLTLSVEGQETMEVEPAGVQVKEDEWRVKRGPPRSKALPGGKRLWSMDLTIEPWCGAGKIDLKLVPLRYRVSADDPPREAEWPPIPVEIVTVIEGSGNEAQARGVADIEKDPPPPPATDRGLTWVFVGVAAGSLLLVGLGIWHRRRRPVALVSPEEVARRELALLAQTTPPPDDPAWHAFRVSAIVRRFVDHQYGLQTARQTTAEVVATWGDDNALPAPFRQSLRELLERCDLARFAGLATSPEDAQALIDLAQTFLKAAGRERALAQGR